MELIYLRVEKSRIGINDEEINFSTKYKVELKNRKLIIRDLGDKRPNIFGEKFLGISAIVGKNGVGKSTILESISLSSPQRNKYLKSFHTLCVFFLGKLKIKGKRTPFFYLSFDAYVGKRIDNVDKSGYYYIHKNEMIRVDYRSSLLRGMCIKEQLYEISKKSLLSYIRLQPNIEWLSKKSYIGTTSKEFIVKQSLSSGNVSDLIQFISNSPRNKNKNDIKLILDIILPLPYRSAAQLFYIYHVEYPKTVETFEEFYAEYKDYENKIYNVNERRTFLQHENQTYLVQFLERHLLNLIDGKSKSSDSDIIDFLDEIISYRKDKYTFDWYLEQSEVSYNEKTERRKDGAVVFTREYAVGEKNIKKNLNNNDIDSFLKQNISFLKESIQRLLSEEENEIFLRGYNALVDLCEEGRVNRSSVRSLTLTLDMVSSATVVERIQKVTESFDRAIKIEFSGLSDGESVYYNTYSTIHSILVDRAYRNKIIVLDEPDLNLHPEWSRRFISKLVELVNSNLEGDSVQIILTTHSPYLVTDIPKHFVFNLISQEDSAKLSQLEEVQKLDSKQVIIRNAEVSFGANIFDLMGDAFFLESTIGEYAKRIIMNLKNFEEEKRQEIIDYIDDEVLKKLVSKSIE